VTDASDTDPGYTLAADGSFTAPLTLAYPYSRTVGPTYGRFLTGLAEGRFSATVGSDGRVFVPPAEFDPTTGQALDQWVDVADEGTVVSWSWQPEPSESQPLNRPFAWVLVRLDGADTALLHVCDVSDPQAMETGMRVRARFVDGADPGMAALECFEPVGDAAGNDGGNRP
jgi:uncharacterized OB-fold protein